MASQVFSGNGNFSYTNNTGQNVRVVINFMGAVPTQRDPIFNTITAFGVGLSWGSGTGLGSAGGNNVLAIGRNLAFSCGVGKVLGTRSGTTSNINSAAMSLAISSNNMAMANIPSDRPERSPQVDTFTDITSSELDNAALPTELMLAPGHSFSASCGAYNIVVIPEAG